MKPCEGWKEIYEVTGKDETMNWNAWEAEWLARRMPLDGALILDIGAGDGRWMGTLIARGAWAYGVDVNPRNARVECATFPDLSSAPLLPSRYDCITCRESLYYLPFDKALDAIRSLLLPGGCLYIKSRHGRPDGLVTHTPSPDFYADTLQAAGFRLLAERSYPRTWWGRLPARFLLLAARQ